MQTHLTPVIDINLPLPLADVVKGKPQIGEYIILKGIPPRFPIRSIITGQPHVLPYIVGVVIQYVPGREESVLVKIPSRDDDCVFYNWVEETPISNFVPMQALKEKVKGILLKRKELQKLQLRSVERIKKETPINKSKLYCNEKLN